MAAYAGTLTSLTRVVKKLGGSPGVGLVAGTFNLTNYNSTLAEVTGITSEFRSAPNVVCSGVSSNGYLVKWDASGKAFKAFYPTKAITPAGTNSKPSFVVQSSGAIGTNMELGLSADSDAATFEGGVGITAARTLTTTSPVGTPTFTGTAVAAQAATEVANDVNVGTVDFIAVGIAP